MFIYFSEKRFFDVIETTNLNEIELLITSSMLQRHKESTGSFFVCAYNFFGKILVIIQKSIKTFIVKATEYIERKLKIVFQSCVVHSL